MWARLAVMPVLLVLASGLAGCESDWHHRVYKRSDQEIERTTGPELHKGTFQGYVAGTAQPVAWAWKPIAFPAYEVWVLYKPDDGGFVRHGAGAPAMPDSYITFVHEDKDDYGEPMPDKAGPGTFRDHVKGKMGVPESDLHVYVLCTDDTHAANETGAFKPGLYKVWQVNHDPYVGPPVAWVWQTATHHRNIWYVYEEDTQWGYHLPGAKNPITLVPYKSADFRFQHHADALDENLLDTDEAAALAAFRGWIMDDPTNDVLEASQLKLYDHRVLKWPAE